MKCPKCGCTLEEHARFCSQCGSQILIEVKAVSKNAEYIGGQEDNKTSPISVILIIFCILCAVVLMGVGISRWLAPLSGSTSQGDELNGYAAESTVSDEQGNSGTQSSSAITYEETVVIDESGVFVRVNAGNVMDGISFYIENNASEDITLHLNALAVNGIMYTDSIYMSEDVAQGKKASKRVSISNAWLEMFSITEIEYINLSFTVYGEGFYSEMFSTDVVKVKTNAYTSDSLWNIEKGTELATGFYVGTEGYVDNVLSIIAINDADYSMVLYIEDMAINDWAFNESYQVFNEWLFPGCAALYLIEVDRTFMAENNISEIESFEFSFDIAPNDDFFNMITTDIINFDFTG